MAADDADSRLEAALDELYGAEPAEFVATRTRLAASLRAAGDASSAKELTAARRPTKVAWALNLLARRRPELVAELLERSDELRAAQTRALAGGPGSQRDATRAQRRALAAAADGAVESVSGGGDTDRAEILSTLHAAAADERVGELLRKGRLVRAEAGATGFPDGFGVDGAAPVDELAERRTRRASREQVVADEHAERSRKTQEQVRAERRAEARRRASDKIAEAALASDEAAAAVDAARADLAEAEDRVAAGRADLAAAQVELRAVKTRVAATEREAARAAKELGRRKSAAESDDRA